MTSTSQNMSSTHNSANTPTVTPSTAPKTSGNNSSSNASGDVGGQYPEQIHAGAVGYGPNYHAGPTLGDKVQGLKDELKGKITHNPDLVQHGRDVRSGEERRKKLTGEDDTNPFTTPDNDEHKSSPVPPDPPSKERTSGSTHQLSGSQTSNVQPRHQSRPMQPAGSAQSHHMSTPDTIKSPQSHDANTSTDNAGTTNLAGLNSPIGLRDGKIQTIAGTPNLAPTTASQQPAFQKETQSGTHLDSNTDTNSGTGAGNPAGLNAPIGLRDGKIQTIAGTPDLAPTTASQQPAFQNGHHSNTHSDQQSQSGFGTGTGFTPQTRLADSSFLREGNSPLGSSGAGDTPGSGGVGYTEGFGNKPYVQQGDRHGNESLAYEPYRTETIGQGGDALFGLTDGQTNKMVQDLEGNQEKRGPNVKFDEAVGGMGNVGQDTGRLPPVPQPRQ